jgi:biotin carboxyl carrier protein
MRRYQITIEGKTFEVEILAVEADQARVLVNGRPYVARFSPEAGARAATPAPARPPAPPPQAARPTAPRPAPGPVSELGSVVAPMPGAILEVLVKVGDSVRAGDTVVKLEAMKMENDLRATISGQVIEVQVSKGDNVAVGDVLLVISPVEG